MADKVVPGPVEGSAAVREAVCIHTRKIFDACRDKDCVEDLRVYPTVSSQTKLDSALSVRPRSAELLCADVRVKEVTFNKGYWQALTLGCRGHLTSCNLIFLYPTPFKCARRA